MSTRDTIHYRPPVDGVEFHLYRDLVDSDGERPSIFDPIYLDIRGVFFESSSGPNGGRVVLRIPAGVAKDLGLIQ